MDVSRTRRVVLAAVVLATIVSCGETSDGGTGADAGGATTVAGSTSGTPSSPDGGPPDSGLAASSPIVEHRTVPAPSLAGNLLGDPAELDVEVQLPASYDTTDQRYPVVYFLAGYGERASVTAAGQALEEAVAAGTAPETIVVAASGVNALGGSFYVDSPVTGDWARAVHTDLVGEIDATYRTIPERDASGIAGFSMGGFGALDLAMRHADVFGSVYALSPGLFDEDGLAESQMFDDPATVEEFIAGQRELAGLPDQEAATELGRAMAPSADVRFSAAYGAAFAPDPDAGPPYIDYPYAAPAGPVDAQVWERWEAGFGGIADEMARFAEDLRSLRGVMVDVGLNDEYAWIPDGCTYFAEQAELHDVPVRLEQYDGGHGPVSLRAGATMWPFFAATLATS